MKKKFRSDKGKKRGPYNLTKKEGRSQIKISKRYLQPTGYDQFRFITVYSDHSISVGSLQRLSETKLLELAVS